VTFSSAVRSALRQYGTLSGRARRSEYWWFFLFTFLVSVLATGIDTTAFGTPVEDNGPTSIITSVALLLPTLAVSVRRLHDVGHSGWFLLIGLIPIVGLIILLVAFVKESDTVNEFGPPPKHAPATLGSADGAQVPDATRDR